MPRAVHSLCRAHLAVPTICAVLAGSALLVPGVVGAQAPTLSRHGLRAATNITWDSATSPHTTTYVDRRAGPSRGAARLAARAERDLRTVTAWLSLPPPDEIAIFVVTRHEDMVALGGGLQRGLTRGAERVVLLLDNDTLAAPLRHELVHVVTSVAWGQPAEPFRWLSEGIAVAVDGCAGHPARAVARRLLEADRLPGLGEIIDRLPALPPGEGYAAAGSLVGFLRDEYGVGALKTLWREGAAKLPLVTGSSLQDLDAAWHRYVAQSPASAPASVLPRMAGRSCT